MALLSRCCTDVALAVVGLALGCCAAVLVALAVVGLAVDCYAAPCLLSCRCCDVLPLVDVIFLDSRAMLPCRWTAMPVQSVEQVGLYGLAGCCIAFALLCCRFGVACISGSVLKVRA